MLFIISFFLEPNKSQQSKKMANNNNIQELTKSMTKINLLPQTPFSKNTILPLQPQLQMEIDILKNLYNKLSEIGSTFIAGGFVLYALGKTLEFGDFDLYVKARFNPNIFKDLGCSVRHNGSYDEEHHLFGICVYLKFPQIERKFDVIFVERDIDEVVNNFDLPFLRMYMVKGDQFKDSDTIIGVFDEFKIFQTNGCRDFYEYFDRHFKNQERYNKYHERFISANKVADCLFQNLRNNNGF